MDRIVRLAIYLIGSFAFNGTCLATETKLIPRQALVTVSERLLQMYRAGDAKRLHHLLAPELQVKYTPERLESILAECRSLAGDIIRISPPVMGTRYFGYSAVYADNRVLDMILEIDNDERVLFWMISPDVTARSQRCKIYNYR